MRLSGEQYVLAKLISFKNISNFGHCYQNCKFLVPSLAISPFPAKMCAYYIEGRLGESEWEQEGQREKEEREGDMSCHHNVYFGAALPRVLKSREGMKTFTQAFPPYGHCIRPEQLLRGKKTGRTPMLTEAFVKGCYKHSRMGFRCSLLH